MLMPLLLLVGGLLVLTLGAELLVRGAAALAAALRIPPLVIGLTVVAYGTSAPELAVSTGAAWQGNPDVALGNVIGSNIANVLLILGIAALIRPLAVAAPVLRRDLWVMLAVSLALLGLGLVGTVGRSAGVALLLGAVIYTIWLIRVARHTADPAMDIAALPVAPPLPAAPRHIWRDAGLALAGLALLVLGAQWMVAGAVQLGTALGVSTLIIGLTVVAVGTSLPELATTIVAALKRQGDLAVGNVVGSNIFNVLSVLGAAAVVSPAGLPIPRAVVAGDLPLMLAATLLCIPAFLTGRRVDRREGLLALLGYAGYVIWLAQRG